MAPKHLHLSTLSKSLCIKLLMNHKITQLAAEYDLGDNMELIRPEDMKKLATYYKEIVISKADALKHKCQTLYKDKLDNSVKAAGTEKKSLTELHALPQDELLKTYIKKGQKTIGKLISTAALMLSEIDLSLEEACTRINEQLAADLFFGVTWSTNSAISKGDISTLNDKINKATTNTVVALATVISDVIVSNNRIDHDLLNYKEEVSADGHEIAFIHAVMRQAATEVKYEVQADEHGRYRPVPAVEKHIDPNLSMPTEAGTAPELAKFVKEDSGIFMKSDGVEGDTGENSLTEVARRNTMTEATKLDLVKSATQIINPEESGKTVRGPRFAQPQTVKIPTKTNDFSGSRVLGLTKHPAFKFNNSQNNFRSIYV
jgi:hypothetical protein